MSSFCFFLKDKNRIHILWIEKIYIETEDYLLFTEYAYITKVRNGLMVIYSPVVVNYFHEKNLNRVIRSFLDASINI